MEVHKKVLLNKQRSVLRNLIGALVVFGFVLGTRSPALSAVETPTPYTLDTSEKKATEAYGGAVDKYAELIAAYDRAIAAYAAATAQGRVPDVATLKLDLESIRQLADVLAEKGTGPDSATLNLDPGSQRALQQLVDSLRELADKTRGDNLWDKPEFSTLMNTLWQAPLVILGIVLAAGAFFGWQGYKDLRDDLREDVRKRVQEQMRSMAEDQRQSAKLWAALNMITLAHSYWRLAEATSKLDSGIPPHLESDAEAHLIAARDFSRKAIQYCKDVPASVGTDGWPRRRANIESGQCWAYHAASVPNSIQEAVWLEILDRSDEALKELTEVHELSEETRRNYAVPWVDTFLYVRVIYARPRQMSEETILRAKRELSRAILVYRTIQPNPIFLEVTTRFAVYLYGEPDPGSTYPSSSGLSAY